MCIRASRKSAREVAAFRFANPEDAYASNSAAGDSRNLGVIGVALFELDAPASGREAPADGPQAFPADRQDSPGYAPPPRYRD